MRKVFYASLCLLLAIAGTAVWRSQAVQQSGEADGSAEEQMIRQLSQGSDLIVTGRCLDTRSMWIENNRVLVTLATIDVGETLKGEPGQTVTVVLPGGIDANRRFPVAMTYPGAPTIAAEEEVFLFLDHDTSVESGWAVSGFSEGKFSVVSDGNGRKLVSRDNVRVSVDAGPGLVRGQRQFVPFDDFKNKVKGHLGR